MNVIQVAVIGVIGALLALQLKGGKTEYGIYMSVAAGIFLFACIIDRLEIFIRTVEQIGSYINLDAGYLGTMLKMVGITYIAEFSSGICRDAGYQTIAVQIEIFSRLTILALGGLRRAVVDGDVKTGSVMAGQIAGMVKEKMSCHDLIQKLVKETDDLIGGKGFYE